jgi:formylmethanofuran dehydrogenase subunit E
MEFEDIVRFHGHSCPGLAMGYRMAAAGLEALNEIRAEDEEIVAITENDACGVDALQCLSGCTFGKGNLIFHDYGKQVYTLYSRNSRKGIRVIYHGEGVPEDVRNDREAYTHWILTAPKERMLSVIPTVVQEPEPARIRQSVVCTLCGEAVMETRIKTLDGKAVCIPCYNASRHT